MKQVPLAFYKSTPSCLFSESDFPGWTFNSLGHGGDDNGGEEQTKNEEPSKRQKVTC